MAPVAATQLPDLRGEAHAGGLDEPGLWLYRSKLLRSDLRITNFGGGGASAKVDAADRLTGETVKVLWVKGSDGNLGATHRQRRRRQRGLLHPLGFAMLQIDLGKRHARYNSRFHRRSEPGPTRRSSRGLRRARA
jgi:hypothetical protein